MSEALVGRLAAAALVVLGVCTLVFLLIHLVPGDPVEAMLGEGARPADRAALTAALGLDRPLGEQYLSYLARLSRLDLGQSFVYQRPVADLLAERLPARAGSGRGGHGVLAAWQLHSQFLAWSAAHPGFLPVAGLDPGERP